MSRPVHRAEVLSIGSELTYGETRDTNAGDLARDLTAGGVVVGRMTALPDDLEAVTAAFRDGLAGADLVVSTGGLGPTPDDLTREAIAAALGETPAVDPRLERWLRALWRRRGIPFPDINLKQAWLIPSAVSIPNANGTAPGWWVEDRDGRVIVALPGPPREMHPMWIDWVLPRLHERGLGHDRAAVTLRTAGIGESALADLLGPDLLRAANPVVATYARSDAVDVRISAAAADGRSAEEVIAPLEAEIRQRLGAHVWARGEVSWARAIGNELAAAGWSLAVSEVGTGGALAALLAELDRLAATESRRAAPALAGSDPLALAEAARDGANADVGIGVVATPRGADTAVDIAVVTPRGAHRESRVAFLGGQFGRVRAGLAGAAVLLERLRADRSAD